MSLTHQLPTLAEYRQRLDIPPVNTGQTMINFHGMVFDNNEGLHSLVNQHGRVQFHSGVEMALSMYRGQVEEYIPCLPSLGRLKTFEAQLLALCRNAAFEEALGDHPYVRLAEHSAFLGSMLHVDRQGLAQHYGLATDRLDLTSNFDVACFFAVCAWNRHKKMYRPVRKAKRPGVIYRIVPALLIGTDLDPQGDEIFAFVGWQPLHRPEQQRACGVTLSNGQDFRTLPTVQKICFRHDYKVSEQYWHMFDKGHALFPPDPAAKLANQAQKLLVFSAKQIETAWARLEKWHCRNFASIERQAVETRGHIQSTVHPQLSWDGLDIERDENRLLAKLEETFQRVRVRLMASGRGHVGGQGTPP